MWKAVTPLGQNVAPCLLEDLHSPSDIHSGAPFVLLGVVYGVLARPSLQMLQLPEVEIES